MNAPPFAPPEVEVVHLTHDTVTIRCDRCGREHVHPRKTGTQYWQSPGCGLTLSPDDRARGYRFTTPPKKGSRNR